MPRPSITNKEAQDLPHEELIVRVDAILKAYDSPHQPETEADRLARLSRTIEEMPEIYRWLLGLWSWCGHWTDGSATMFGIKSVEYQHLRQRRDFFEKMASAAKMRYEAASRSITLMMEFDPTGMPKSRRGPQ